MPREISSVVEILYNSMNRAHRSRDRFTWSDEGEVVREKTDDEILLDGLTSFGRSLTNQGITREIFDRVCEALKKYEGRVCTYSRGSTYSRAEIKYNPALMEAYAPNPARTWPQKKTRYTGRKKSLAENQFHLTGDLTPYADTIFGAAKDQDISNKIAQNSHLLFDLRKAKDHYKYTYRHLMSSINIVLESRGYSTMKDYKVWYEQSTPNRLDPPSVRAHLQEVIDDHIFTSLNKGHGSPVVDRILRLRRVNAGHHPNIDYGQRKRLDERAKEQLIFGFPLWNTGSEYAPCPRNDFESSADAITNEQVQTEYEAMLDVWSDNPSKTVGFPHPEVPIPAADIIELSQLIQEANMYSEILRVIFDTYSDEIENWFR